MREAAAACHPAPDAAEQGHIGSDGAAPLAPGAREHVPVWERRWAFVRDDTQQWHNACRERHGHWLQMPTPLTAMEGLADG